jgi:hypothetical protein
LEGLGQLKNPIAVIKYVDTKDLLEQKKKKKKKKTMNE